VGKDLYNRPLQQAFATESLPLKKTAFLVCPPLTINAIPWTSAGAKVATAFFIFYDFKKKVSVIGQKVLGKIKIWGRKFVHNMNYGFFDEESIAIANALDQEVDDVHYQRREARRLLEHFLRKRASPMTLIRKSNPKKQSRALSLS